MQTVSWNDAQEFIGNLNGRSGGNRYRLPTEAEWEYDARAGISGDRYGNPDAIVWCSANSKEPPARMTRSWNPIALLAPLASIRILYGLILVSYELDRVSAVLLRAVRKIRQIRYRDFSKQRKIPFPCHACGTEQVLDDKHGNGGIHRDD